MADQFKSKAIALDQALPAPGQRVIVVCGQFRVLGYRDENGVLREEWHQENELKDVTGWQELNLGEQYAIQPNSNWRATRSTP